MLQYMIVTTTQAPVDVILVESRNSLNGLWQVNPYSTQTMKVQVEDAGSLIATNIQFTYQKPQIASFAYNKRSRFLRFRSITWMLPFSHLVFMQIVNINITHSIP